MGPTGVVVASGGEGKLRASDKRGTGNCDELHADMCLTCSLRCGRRRGAMAALHPAQASVVYASSWQN